MSIQPLGKSFFDYGVDAWQRSALFFDILRERGNTVLAHRAETTPHVLSFEPELVMSGRDLPRPVNYALVRIRAPEGVSTDPRKPPFVVVDPRAGHGPGIGGMKANSEIGVALEAGHPCYFIGFGPEPIPDQTIEDVCRAEISFIEEVTRRHSDTEGKPVVVANCQAGWQTMIAAAMRPDLMGPILLAGSPLSYWAGARGANPMRYLGGVLGGTWITALAGDLGCGIFDGAWLVENFESLDPANTWWDKPYNVYDKADSEGPRFIEFETWWGSPVLLNAGEMQWIADNLFVGNKLSTGALRTTDGVRIDLRDVKSPIIVFCSWGDNITPPQQALGWIPDVYRDDREIAANGQTIVYTLHPSIGHLGIFVSGKVAGKEHQEITTCMDMIDLAPPGIYEAVITEVDDETGNPELINGRYLFRLEARSLDDIRKIVDSHPDEDLCFAVAARVSEINHELYRTVAQPVVQLSANSVFAQAARDLHPSRLRFSLLSDRNPLMQWAEFLGTMARDERRPVSPDNPFRHLEHLMSSWVSRSLDAWRVARDGFVEKLFFAAYGQPLLRSAVGLGQAENGSGRHIERSLSREADAARALAELDDCFDTGEPVEAALRGLCYVNQSEGVFDERENTVIKQLRASVPPSDRKSLAAFKQAIRQQSLLVRLDPERAVSAIPKLLKGQPERARAALTALHQVVDARHGLSEEGQRRLQRIDKLFETNLRRADRLGAAHA
jgi:hypothetical protein